MKTRMPPPSEAGPSEVRPPPGTAFSGPVVALATLCVLLVGGLWGAIGAFLAHEHQQSYEQGRRDGNNLAIAFERHLDGLVRSIDSALLHLRQEHREGAANFAESARELRSGPLRNSVLQFGIIDPDGFISWWSDPMPGPVFLGEREHFRRHRDASEDRLIISAPFFGKVSKRWSVHLSRRITAADGSFAGVVVIAVAADQFSAFIRDIDVGPGGAISAFHSEGRVIARSAGHGPTEVFSGRAVDLSPLKDFPGEKSAWWLRPSPFDGVMRLTSYRRHDDYPLAVTVSLAADDLLAGYRDLRTLLGLAGLAITLMFALIMVRLLRSERRRAASERAASEHEKRFRQMFEKAPLAYMALDTRGRIIEINEAWEALFGYPLAKVQGQPFNNFVAEDSLDTVARGFAALAADGRVDQLEFEIVRKDGSRRRVAVNGRDSGDGTRRRHCILTDVTQTRAQEAALKASEARLRGIVEGINVATWELDLATWQFTYVSPQVETMFGYPAADWLTLNFWPEHLHPDDRVWAVQYCISCTHRLEDHDFEYRFIARDGRIVWVRDIVKVVVGGNGKPVRLTGVMVDITPEKAAAADLAGKEAQLRSLIDSVPDLIFFKDRNGAYLGSNRAFAELVGRPESELIGKTDFDFFDAETAALFRRTDQEMLASGGARHNEEWVTYPDGRRVLHDTLKTPFRGPKGEPLGMIGISRDITAQRQAEESLRRSEARFRSYVEQSIDGILVTDADGRFIDANPAAAAIFGYPREVLLQLSIADTVPDDLRSRETARRAFETLRLTGRTRYQRTARRRDGSLVDVEVHSGRIDDHLYLGIVRDISDRRRAEEAARLTQSVFESTAEGIVVTDERATILSVNPAFARITGWSAAEAVGSTPAILKSGRHPPEFYSAMWAALIASGHWEGEVWNRRRDGEVYAESIAINAIRDDDGNTVKYVGLFSDITQRKLQEEEVWRQANFDALTGLPNRNLFHDRLDRALARARRNPQQVGLMFIDLDRFKWVNDTLGHAAGDALLIEAAQRLRGCVREEDTVARIGGDEFTIVLQGLADHEPLQTVAEKILEVLARPFALDGTLQYISGSIGITTFPNDSDSSEQLLRNADIAMYRAKEAGKNRYQFYSPDMQADALARIRIEQDLRAAVEAGAFVLHYQPIVDVDSGELIAAEALLRWQHPEHGLVAPDDFLAIAEEAGLMLPIGEWVIDEACRQWRAWTDAGQTPVNLSINVATVHFRDPALRECLRRNFARHRIPAQVLTLEVTEGLFLNHGEITAKQLAELRELGLRYALDDFGTGYSSLSTLKHFPFDSVKIDRSFVADCASNVEDAHLIEAIVFMAHSLGLQVIAEGVESFEQLDFLRDLGCDSAQGFLISKPLTAAELEVQLSRRILLPDAHHTAEESRFLAALRRDNVDPRPWVGRLLAERDPALAEHLATHGCHIGRLDLCAAIVAHLQWRGRLEAMILDDVIDPLTSDEAGDDRRCSLGDWLEGQRLTPTGRLLSFTRVLARHREFHQTAASILDDLRLGRRGEARRRTRGLAFRKASHEVVTALIDLFVEERIAG